MRRTLTLIALVAAGSVFAADPPPARAVRYEADIAPLFAGKCQVCHAGNQAEGRFDVSTFAAVMKGGKRGPAVVPGKSGDSLLWQLAAGTKKPVMPPKSENNPLTPAELAALKRWIDQGAAGPAADAAAARPRVAVGLLPAAVTPVRAVAVSPDKRTVAAGRGNRVLLFDSKTGALQQTLTDPALTTPDGKPADAAHASLVESIAYSPDGRTLATGSFQEVTLWDVATGSVRKRLTGFADRVVALAYSADGKYLTTGGGAPTEDGEVRLYDAATGGLVTEIKGGHSDTVFGVSFSPDGKLLATAAADKFVKVFAVPGGKLVKAFEGHTQHVLDVAWTADGRRLISAGADDVVKVWDYEKGEKLKDIRGNQKQVTRLAVVGKTAQFLTASGDGAVRQWNADSGVSMRTFPGGQDFVYAVAASPDGAVVASGGEEGLVRLYDGATGQLLKAVGPPPAAAPKVDGPRKPEPPPANKK